MAGGSKQTTNSTTQTSPYGPAQGTIDNILSQLGNQVNNSGLTSTETGALDTLKANASAGNPFAGSISDAAKGLLNGGGAQNNDAAISNNFTDYKGLLTPYANGSMIGNNPALKAQLDAITNDVTNQVNSQFAAAGRDGSGANLQTLGRGIAQGTAPVIAQQYNTDVDRSLGAANSIYGAGNTTTGLLNGTQQAANANKTTGVGVGSAALDAKNWGANSLLAEEAQRRGIPVQNLQTLLGAVSPVAQAFGTTNGTQTTQTQQPLLNTIVGGLTGGLGLLGGSGAFGPTGWLYGTGKTASGLFNS